MGRKEELFWWALPQAPDPLGLSSPNKEQPLPKKARRLWVWPVFKFPVVVGNDYFWSFCVGDKVGWRGIVIDCVLSRHECYLALPSRCCRCHRRRLHAGRRRDGMGCPR